MSLATLNKKYAGRTVHYVVALRDSSYLSSYKIVQIKSRPTSYSDLPYIHAVYESDSPSPQAFSLLDCNVIKNKYNNHRLFLNEQAAERYLKKCLH